MKIVYATESVAQTKSELLVVPFVQDGKNPLFHHVNQLTNGSLVKEVKREKFNGEENSVLEWCGRGKKLTATRIAIVGMGKQRYDAATWRYGFSRALNVAKRRKLKNLSFYVEPGNDQALTVCVQALCLGTYRFDQYKTKKSDGIYPASARVGVFEPEFNVGHYRQIVKNAVQTAQAVTRCRHWVNEPANVLGPERFYEEAKAVAAESNLEIEVWTGKQLVEKGFHLLHAVGNGAIQSPRLVHLRYSPSGAQMRIALVGKGITFDSGGLCLKPGASMYEMKTDMAGAALVLSVMSALESLGISVQVDGYIPLAENAVGSNAVRPGDVIRSYGGPTVEILNTDAEGRLILADALAYAAESKPDQIIDYATLTGACSIALGNKRGAVFSSRDGSARAFVGAAVRAGEYVWHMPLAKELEKEIRSEVADIKNIGGRFGGTIVAALFLKRFVKNLDWIHIDLAGPARNAAATTLCPKGGTGYGVLTTLEYLMSL